MITKPRLLLGLVLLILSGSTASSRLQVTEMAGFGVNETAFYMKQWSAAVRGTGGVIDGKSSIIARNLITRLMKKSYFAKIQVVYPFLGANLAAARVPLFRRVGPVALVNNNFVEADYSLSTGIQGNGTTKYFDTQIRASEIGTTNNGGILWIETNVNFTGTTTEVMGSYNNGATERYVIDLRLTQKFGSWGNAGNVANLGTAAANGRYYFQRSSATSRELFFNGASIATNATSDTASGAANRTMFLFAVNAPALTYGKGRSACVVFTDGTLSSGDVADLDQLLVDYLLTPTGR